MVSAKCSKNRFRLSLVLAGIGERVWWLRADGRPVVCIQRTCLSRRSPYTFILQIPTARAQHKKKKGKT